MKLYYSPGACSLSPHITLREAGQKFDLVKVDLGSKKTESGGDYTQVNAKGYVPALELDNGEVLIVQYIADKAPGAKLAPANGTMERYKLQEWLNFITSELHKGFGGLFNDKMPDAAKEIMRTNLLRRLTHLDKHLASNDYVLGSSFSVADPYLFTVLGWGKWAGIDIDAFPAVKAYLARIGSRPKVREAMTAEGLV